MFGDNELVVNSASLVHSKLYKRHNALLFHRVREAIASRCIDFNFLSGPMNPADILSKQWSDNKVKDLLLPLFNQHGETDKGQISVDGVSGTC